MTELADSRYPGARLLVFARTPVAGAVKTRLAAGIGAEAAAQLYRDLLQGTLEMAVAARLVPVDLYVTPDAGHPFIQSLAQRLPVVLRPQRGTDDLGQRMHNALRDALRDSEFALLIGTDCPVMTAAYLDQACRKLQAGNELVIGPAEDGGYILIGARRCCQELFESIPWGSAAVLQATRERAQALRLRYAELEPLWDIDTAADLERWRGLRGSAHTPQLLPSDGVRAMKHTESDTIRQSVRDSYARVAEASDSGGCCGEASSCCGVSQDVQINSLISTRLGYSAQDLGSVPQGADMGLGCGNPRAIASLKPGEVVLDLGSGGGFDAFLAAREVGDSGRVIGVDMTPQMISKARRNAEQGHFGNVEFRLGEIEHLPVADASVDVIISNCVINLSPNKPQVFRETWRVLKAGGRLAISDVVASTELPASMRDDPYLHSACVAGASLTSELENWLSEAGFVDIRIRPKDESRQFIRDWVPGSGVEDYVLSATIEARKPAAGGPR